MLQFADKAIAYLASGITTASTSVVVQTGKGALFPALGNGLVSILKIEEPSTGAYELVKATALSTDTFTVERSYGGTNQAFDITAIVSLVFPANAVKAIMGRRNRFINGCFRLWDYGTSFATPASGTTTANRWKVTTAGSVGTFTISRLASTPGDWENDNPPKFYLRWNQTVAGAAATLELEQRIEDVRQFANGKLTVALEGKCAASTVAIGVYVQQVFGSGGGPSATVTQATQTVTLSTTHARKEVTFNIPSILGKTIGTADDYVRVAFVFPGSATFDVQITDMQSERGPIATDFEFRHEAAERILARRYCVPLNQSGAAHSRIGAKRATLVIDAPIDFASMRAPPTLKNNNITAWSAGAVGANQAGATDMVTGAAVTITGALTFSLVSACPIGGGASIDRGNLVFRNGRNARNDANRSEQHLRPRCRAVMLQGVM